MTVIFFDTETTGIGERDRLCQLAVKERGVDTPIVNAIYKPPLPIAIDAMAIHHITEKMAADKPAFTEAEEYPHLQSIFEHDETIAVAHNAAFDVAMLSREGIVPRQTICTYKVAKAIDHEERMPRYQLQYLRYLLDIEIDAIAHDAFGDVMVLEAVFEKLLEQMIEIKGSEEAAIAEMLDISSRPMVFTTFRFGKHNGKKIADVAESDPSYLEWLLAQKRQKPTGEEEWIYTLEHYLGRAS